MSAIRPKELEALLAKRPAPIVIDLRSRAEFEAGSIAGARNLPWADDLAARLAGELERTTPIVVVCAWGHRSVVASIALRREHFRDVRFLDGGMESWGLAGLPIVRVERRAESAVTR
ncbi:MAG TPA: rhodanese-like domain-containing protein [bacterium]|nr:rhodanese-like domain-containing protein [bacterium]